MLKRERIIKLSGDIAALRAKIAEVEPLRVKLADLELALDLLLREPQDPSETNRAKAGGNGRNSTTPYYQQVLGLLARNPDRIFTTKEVAEALGVGLISVRGPLSRLTNAKKIVRETAPNSGYRAALPNEQGNGVRP